MMRIFAAFFLVGFSAVAQPVSFGIRGGVPLTDAFNISNPTPSTYPLLSESKEYAIGPMVEVHLPFGLSVEGDALYRPLSYDQTLVSGVTSTSSFASWEFPVIGKYRFLHTPLIKPYIAAGPSFRHVSASYFSSAGFILGGGVEIKVSRLRIEPEIRYYRWGGYTSPLALYPPTQLNQAEFLVGITF